MLDEVDNFVFFPSVSWNHNWERQHELIYKFSEILEKYIYISQPLGMINYSFSELLMKIKQRNEAQTTIISGNRSSPGMKFISPKIIPYHYFPAIDRLNCFLFKRQFPFLKNRKNFLWATYVNGVIYELLKTADVKILDIAVRRQMNPYLSKKAKDIEKRAVEIADLVFVDNYNTYLDYKNLTENINYVPQAVDFSRFEISYIAPEYRSLKQNTKVVIGYSGALHQYIDFELLDEVIKAFPNYIFMFVGNVIDQRANVLKTNKNAIFTGRKNYEELPSYYKIFDIGLIPYKLEPFTSGVFPTKFFEYAASGIPIISSRLPDLLNYDYPFLKLYNDSNEFISFIKELVSKGHTYKTDLINFAKQNSWESRFSLIIDKIKELK